MPAALAAFNPVGMIAGPGGSSSNGPHQLADVQNGCGRKWAMRYYQRIQPVAEPSFRLVGTLLHTYAAYYYGARLVNRPVWMDVPLESELERLAAGRPADIRQAHSCFQAYEQVAAGRPWLPVAVEEETLFTPRSMGWELEGWGDVADEPFSARVDLEINANGGIWAVDHKSTSPRSSRLEAWNDDGEYALSWQMLVISLLMRRKYGEQYQGILINRLKRSAPFDFDFHPVRMPEAALLSARLSVLTALRQRLHLRSLIARNETLPANFSQCFGRYGACDYISLCKAESEDERAAIRKTMFRVVS